MKGRAKGLETGRKAGRGATREAQGWRGMEAGQGGLRDLGAEEQAKGPGVRPKRKLRSWVRQAKGAWTKRQAKGQKARLRASGLAEGPRGREAA